MMKLKNGVSFPEFLRSTSRCEGEVWFQTPAGDRINLKSELSKYLFLAVASGTGHTILDTGEVCCDQTEDYMRLSDFLTEWGNTND